MDADRASPSPQVGLLRLQLQRKALRHGRKVELHDWELEVRRCLRPGNLLLVPDEERLCDGHSSRCAGEETVLYGVEAEAVDIRPGGQLVEDGTHTSGGSSTVGFRFGILDGKLLLLAMKDEHSYKTLVYDPKAPSGSEWGTCEIKPSGLCLCSVTVKA
ncbi:hypothetical protein LINPERHAP2_LOCUS18739 [Linum perenne]